jgi:orotidine-5'-phosphate decarboxylase
MSPVIDEKCVIVALDFPALDSARQLLDQLDSNRCRIKIGKEMFTRYGPAFVKEVIARGFDVFLDLKFHDIPNTVAKAVTAAADLGVWMVNVHAAGGREMMLAARQAVEQSDHQPLLIGVTVLTSMSQIDLNEIGVLGKPEDQVLKLALLAQHSGLDGVVCSAAEAGVLRSKFGSEFVLVTPGIRPEGDVVNDQKRVVTPADAIQNGSNFLVIGRPITQAANPKEKLESIFMHLYGSFPKLC